MQALRAAGRRWKTGASRGLLRGLARGGISRLIDGGEVVCQTLNGVDAWLFDGSLGDLGQGRKRDAATGGNLALGECLGAQAGHDKIVYWKW